eukprot:TRINITY_DN26071_c0_g1_i1.p1 TRINITY_DN26071_c0_g1~~TRINITY_DN26071_c0_g1_i1.p1  ORF type:complete len:688 (-),score=70.93 TRINITY_DN26071_c0_g1_i1:335-2398(-)
MASHALPPASPMLSPGRQLYQQVPQSPVVAFRPAVASLSASGNFSYGPVGGAVAASPTLVARHTKSTSDLGPGRRGCYDPSRLQACSHGPSMPTMGGSAAVPVHSYPSPPGTVVSGARACSPRNVRKSHTAASPPSITCLVTPHSVSGCRQPMNLARSPSPELVRAALPAQSASAAAPAGPSRCLRSVTRETSYAPPSPAQANNGCHLNGDGMSRPRTMAGQCRSTFGHQLSAGQEDVPKNAGAAVPHEVFVPCRAGSMNLPCSTGSGNHDGRQPQEAKTRNSLLQHIQSVQQEITRLQAERQNQLLRQQSSLRDPDRSRLVCVSKQSALPSLPKQAAVKLQRWWRRAKEACRRQAGTKGPGVSRPSGPLRPVHFAAARIQRAWRISNWRRRFVEVSAKQLGWLGSLAWLQEKNLLYGTELADAEDASWWIEQQRDAPLDHEVDPWGALKLRDHLDRMWYGQTSDETTREEEQQRLRLKQQQQQLILQQGRQLQSSTEQLLTRKDQRTEGLGQGRYSLSMQDMYDLQIAGRLRGKSPTQGSAMSLTSPVAAQPSRSMPLSSGRCGPRASRGCVQRGIPAALPKTAGKSASLSPRLEMRMARGDAPSRAGQILQSSGPVVHAMRSFLSPPSTHRALGSSPVSQLGGARQQSPLASNRSAQIPVMCASAARPATMPMPRMQCGIINASG